MALDKSRLASAGGNSLRGKAVQQFTYRTTDSMTTVMAASYFDDVWAMLDLGDIIYVAVMDSLTSPTTVVAANQIMVTGKNTTTHVIQVSDYALGGASISDYDARLIRVPFTISATDLSAGTSQYVIAPVAGTITRLVTVVQVAISTGGAVTLKAAGTSVAGVSNTHANSALVGSLVQSAPTAADASAVVAAGAKLEIISAAAFNGGGELTGYVEIQGIEDNGDVFIPFWANSTDLLAGTSQWIASPVAGQIVEIGVIVQTAVTTGGTVTAKLATVAVTGLSVTVADAAAVGTVYTDAPTSLTGATGTVAKDTVIEVVLDAAFATAGAINGYIRVRPTTPSTKRYIYWFANQTDVLAPTSHFIGVPEKGNINRGTTVVNIAIGTGGNVTFLRSTVTVSGLTIVVANSGPAGDMDNDTAVWNDITTEFQKDDAVEIAFGSAFATTGSLWGYLEITRGAN